MVRLMLVRHAHSVQNEYTEHMLAKVASGEIALEDFNQAMRNGPRGASAFEDAVLTKLGEVQAQKFGHFWSPLLSKVVKDGNLHIVVSPFQRTMATADTLIKLLRQVSPDLKATVTPLVMEVGALTTFEDMRHLDVVNAKIKEGKRAEAVEYLKAVEWMPAGLTGREIEEKYSWADLKGQQLDFEELRFDFKSDHPWWTEGYQGKKASGLRMKQLTEWILDILEKLPDDAVVLIVTHGETIETIVNKLLHFSFTGSPEYNPVASFTGIRNTSMTCLHLPSSEHTYLGARPTSKGDIEEYTAMLEFFNDTTHLGQEQHIEALRRASAKL